MNVCAVGNTTLLNLMCIFVNAARLKMKEGKKEIDGKIGRLATSQTGWPCYAKEEGTRNKG